MLIERTTFAVKYGKGDALLDVLREFVRTFGSEFNRPMRVATDRTGPMFTVVWDMEYESLDAWAAGMNQERAVFGRPDFGAWFAKMEPLIDSGKRELFETVDI